MAARWNSSRAPERPRRRMRLPPLWAPPSCKRKFGEYRKFEDSRYTSQADSLRCALSLNKASTQRGATQR
jgi:hypothetical protein